MEFYLFLQQPISSIGQSGLFTKGWLRVRIPHRKSIYYDILQAEVEFGLFVYWETLNIHATSVFSEHVNNL